MNAKIKLYSKKIKRDLTGIKPSYAFIVHPRKLSDITDNWPEFRKYFESLDSESMINEVNQLCTVIGGDILRENDEKYGVFIPAFFMPEILKTREGIVSARKKILDAADFAHDLGCQHVGLGGLSAALTGYGSKFIDKPYIATTGHSLTSWNIVNNIRILEKIANKNFSVLILGAAGSMGRLVFENLNRIGLNSISVADIKKADLEKYYNSKLYEHQIYHIDSSEKIYKVINLVDLVVSVTNADRVLINIANVPKGKILLDDAQPWCWNRYEGYNRFVKHGDILPVEAGLLTSYDNRMTLNTAKAGLPHDLMFSCLVEVYLLSSNNGRLKPTVGVPNPANYQEYIELSNKYGAIAQESKFRTSDWQCGPYKLPNDKVDDFLKTFFKYTN